MDIEKIIKSNPVLQSVRNAQETVWINPNKKPFISCGQQAAGSFPKASEKNI